MDGINVKIKYLEDKINYASVFLYIMHSYANQLLNKLTCEDLLLNHTVALLITQWPYYTVALLYSSLITQ